MQSTISLTYLNNFRFFSSVMTVTLCRVFFRHPVLFAAASRHMCKFLSWNNKKVMMMRLKHLRFERGTLKRLSHQFWMSSKLGALVSTLIQRPQSKQPKDEISQNPHCQSRGSQKMKITTNTYVCVAERSTLLQIIPILVESTLL